MLPRSTGSGPSTGQARDVHLGPDGHTTQVSQPQDQTPSETAAERLQRRYPPSRFPRPLLIALIVAGVTVAMTWLIWSALLHSRPAVAAQVAAYTVVSDTSIRVTITVDRRDPSRPVTCRLLAQAADFQPVAEQQVPIGASAARLVDTTVTLTTLRRATSATVKGCTLA
ncbi:MAG: hypothetical protein JWP61_409 [Friedmanniella sp.]|nr:hypothetical protein [Friedmanniella sp.]